MTARRVYLAAIAIAAGALPACRSSAPYTLPAVGVEAALGLGMSAVSRARGGCYSRCTGGTTCNPRTGLCESAAGCDGRCLSTEICVEDGVLSRCEPRSSDAAWAGVLKLNARGPESPGPGGVTFAPATAPPPTLPAPRPGTEGR